MWISQREFEDEETLEKMNKMNQERQIQDQDFDKINYGNVKKK